MVNQQKIGNLFVFHLYNGMYHYKMQRNGHKESNRKANTTTAIDAPQIIIFLTMFLVAKAAFKSAMLG